MGTDSDTDDLYELIDLPVEADSRGRLTYVEQRDQVPFDIKRIYYIYDVPEDAVRGEHAHEALEQVLIAVNGRLDVVVDDGEATDKVTLDSPGVGLYLPSMRWRTMERFSTDAVCLVLASDYYDPSDYIHEYEAFRTRSSDGDEK